MKEIYDTAWSKFLAKHPEANFLQSTEWGKLHEILGDKVLRRGIYDDGELVAGWQGIVKDARRGRYLEVPGAPILDWTNQQEIEAITDQLREVAREHRCVFVRIRPQEIDSAGIVERLSQAGYKKASMHLHAEHTNILYLTPPTDDILAGMRRQTRYEVRRADRQKIEVSWRSDVEAIEEFAALQAVTAKRQGFVPPSLRFLLAQQEAFGDKLRIYRAEVDGKVQNLALVIFWGEEADYHEAASAETSRDYAGAYAIQWQAIRDAKAMGLKRYNFWGIAYSDNPKHRYAGVTTFKRGFGGTDTTYVAAQDIVIDKIRYIKNWGVETIRRKRRGL